MEERPRQPQRREETRLSDVHEAGSRLQRPDPQITLDSGAQNPLVRFAALELWSGSGTGAKVGLTVTLYHAVDIHGNRLDRSVVLRVKPRRRR